MDDKYPLPFEFDETIADKTSRDEMLEENIKRRTLAGPWKNVVEFKQVYEWIFGAQYSPVTRKQAISQINVWNLRRGSQCPAAVLATSVIIEVQQKDHPETCYCDEVLQISYAHAFIRFFNFMSSIMQTHNMRTMYETAEEMGLESFVVDLRHMCAHGQVLPPLHVLRNVAEYCLQWLHDYYWAKQSGTMSAVDATHIRRKDKTAFDDNVTALFNIYDAALEGHMKGATSINTLKRHLHGDRFNNLKKYYAEHDLKCLKDTFGCVLKELNSLVKRDTTIKDIGEIYIGALLKMRYFFNLTGIQESDESVEILLDTTQSLFRMLAVHCFLEDFFLSLIKIAENPLADPTKRKGSSFWAVEIAKGFKAFRRCKEMFKREMNAKRKIKDAPFCFTNISDISEGTRTLYIYGGVDMKRTLLFGNHFRQPWIWVFQRSFLEKRIEAINKYTAPIIKNILPLIIPILNTSEMKTFSKLIECYFEYNNETEAAKDKNKNDNTEETVYTAEDLLKELEKTHLSQKEVNGSELNEDVINKPMTSDVWTGAEDYDWKSCPLGRVPWEI